MTRSASPLEGNTTDWRAGCGRSACPVRREGGTGQPSLPTPIGRDDKAIAAAAPQLCILPTPIANHFLKFTRHPDCAYTEVSNATAANPVGATLPGNVAAFPQRWRNGWLCSADRLQRRHRLDATVPSPGKWVVREASCLPKINISSKWPALLPILTLRLRIREQGFRARRLALRIIEPIRVVLNSLGSLWVTGLDLTSDPLPDDHYWMNSGLGQMYQLSPER